MADNTQTQVELLAHQELTHPGSIIGSAQDVSTWLSGVVHIFHANIETTANLAAGLDYIDVQGSPNATGNLWQSLGKYAPSTTAATDTAFDANEAISQTVLSVATTAGKTTGAYIYLKDATSVATSEWNEVVSVVTDDTVTVVDGIIVAKVATDDHMYTQASRWAHHLPDLSGYQRIRVVVHHQGATGSDWRVYAVLEAATDFE
jgi:hypothetical protein